jgi:transcriptional regulator with XRE-family HTH domain
MTQAQLAEAVDCEPSYLQKLEYGSAAASLVMVARLAKHLRAPAATLFRAAKPRRARRGRPRAARRV